jgi:hypothetical protein
MCVDCVLASSRITQVDPGDEPLPEVVLSQSRWLSTTKRERISLQSLIFPKKEDKEKVVSMRCDQHVDKDQCMWCKKKDHYQKNCIEFLKHLNK